MANRPTVKLTSKNTGKTVTLTPKTIRLTPKPSTTPKYPKGTRRFA